MAKQDLPNVVATGTPVVGENFLQEKIYYETLYAKATRTDTGTKTFETINDTYSTADYPDDVDVNNKGELGMMNLLAKYVLNNYMISATDFNGKLDKTGDTLTGDINTDGNKITGLPTPTGDTDVATKGYVDEIYKNYSSGYVTYTDTITWSNSLTKTINIPVGAYRGVATIVGISTSGQYKSALLNFTTDNLKGKIFGTYSEYNSVSSAWSVRSINSITDSNYGEYASGSSHIDIKQFYIDSANNQIKIVFTNTSSFNDAYLNCTIDWEVWY